jgi:hypothetical protein
VRRNPSPATTRARTLVRTLLCTVVLSLSVASFLGCSPRHIVVFWSNSDTVKTASPISESRQLAALREAKPGEDARRAIESGDLRLISARTAFTIFPGTPNDNLVYSSSSKFGFKIIGRTEDLLTNQEFLTLSTRYEEEFNRYVYDYLLRRKSLSE